MKLKRICYNNVKNSDINDRTLGIVCFDHLLNVYDVFRAKIYTNNEEIFNFLFQPSKEIGTINIYEYNHLGSARSVDFTFTISVENNEDGDAFITGSYTLVKDEAGKYTAIDFVYKTSGEIRMDLSLMDKNDPRRPPEHFNIDAYLLKID